MQKDAGRLAADTQTRTSTTLLGRVALTGDEPACAEFVARYAPMVKAIARARGLPVEDCDDLTQEVMMAAIDALREHRYDRQIGRFKAWLKGVIYHRVNRAWPARRQRWDRFSSPTRGDAPFGIAMDDYSDSQTIRPRRAGAPGSVEAHFLSRGVCLAEPAS